MEKLYFVVLLFFLCILPGYGQTEIARFNLNPARDVWVLKEPQSEETLLVFHNTRNFHLRWLNDEMEVSDSTRISKPPKRKYRFIRVHGVVNQEEEIHVFYSRINRKTIRGLTLHKKDRTCTPFSPELVSAPTDPYTVIKAFSHDEQFYILLVGRESGDLRLYVYDSPQEYRVYQYKLGVPGLLARLNRPGGVFIPRVTDPWENVLATNVLKEKLYDFPGEIIMTIEREAEGVTEMFTLDTDSMKLQKEQYPIDGWVDKGPGVQINSYLYQNQLFQAVLNDEGLTLSARSLEDGQLLRRRNFPHDISLRDYLGPLYHRKFRDGTSNSREIPELMNRLSRSMGIILMPNNESSDWLTVGAYKYLKPGMRNVLQVMTYALAAAGEVGVATAANNQTYVGMAALTEVAYEADIALASNQGSYYYLETPISFRDFVKMEQDDPAESGDPTAAAPSLPGQDTEEPIWGYISFVQQEQTYLGYGQGNTYRLYVY